MGPIVDDGMVSDIGAEVVSSFAENDQMVIGDRVYEIENGICVSVHSTSYAEVRDLPPDYDEDTYNG